MTKKGFTLIELIIVIAIIALIAAAVFVSVDPAQRIGDAKDSVRVSDAIAIEKAMQKAIAEGAAVPVSMAALTEDTPYMLVTEGGDDTGTCNCNTLDQAINRVDIAGDFESYLGVSVPVDSEASGDDTGYYVTRKSNSFYVEPCNAYGDEYEVPQTCGNGILEGTEVCDSNFTVACTVDTDYYEGGYVGTGACDTLDIVGCNNTCDACKIGAQCRAGGPS